MIKNRCLTIAATVCLLFVHPILQAQSTQGELWEKAIRIHRKALVIDTHCDTPMAMLHNGLDIGARKGNACVDLNKMETGAMDAMFFAVFVSNSQDAKQSSREALDMIDEIIVQVNRYPDRVELARSAADIARLHQINKKAILIGMENGGPLEKNLRFLRQYYRLGVRYLTLTHNSHNPLCDSSTDKSKPLWNGLSPFGRQVVAEMNRLGMIIDVSHISDKAFWDVINTSAAPVMASHSCVRALCNHPRNMDDSMIRALADKGGVIQINFAGSFLSQTFLNNQKAAMEKLKPRFAELRKKFKDDRRAYWQAAYPLWKKSMPRSPEISVLIDHIDHVVKLAGVDHVGLGSDYDGASGYPQGLEDVSGFPLITYNLLKRGYSEQDILKILGKNFMRVFRDVEKTASRLNSLK